MIEKRNNHKTIVIIILTILVLALAGLSSYLMFFKGETIVDCNAPIIEEKDDTIEYKINIFGKKNESGDYYVCNHQSETDNCKEVLFTIKTETPNTNIIHSNLIEDTSFQYVVYYDNGVKLFNVKDESITKLDIDLNGNINWVDDGFIYNSEEEAYYFDFKANKRTFDKYDKLSPVEDSDNIKYLNGKKGSSSTLLDFKSGNVIITINNSDYESIDFTKEGSYIIASLKTKDKTIKEIYNTKGDKKVELKDNQTYEINGSKLVIYETSLNKVKEY